MSTNPLMEWRHFIIFLNILLDLSLGVAQRVHRRGESLSEPVEIPPMHNWFMPNWTRIQSYPRNHGEAETFDGPCGVSPLYTEGASNSNRIYGGSIARPNQHPWMVRLTIGTFGHCGGTLISRRHILTAFHCTWCSGKPQNEIPCYRDYAQGRRFAVLGTHTYDAKDFSNYYTIPIKDIKVPPHPGFECGLNLPSSNHDLALGILADDVKFSNLIRPICLPRQGHWNLGGLIATAAGWGRYSTDDGTRQSREPSRYLKDVQLRVSPMQYQQFTMFGTEVYYGMDIEDPCVGDSGGPLMRKDSNGQWEIIGILFGAGFDCKKGQVNQCQGSPNGVWTKVSVFSDWINNVMMST